MTRTELEVAERDDWIETALGGQAGFMAELIVNHMTLPDLKNIMRDTWNAAATCTRARIQMYQQEQADEEKLQPARDSSTDAAGGASDVPEYLRSI